jgi:hypothetical protein
VTDERGVSYSTGHRSRRRCTGVLRRLSTEEIVPPEREAVLQHPVNAIENANPVLLQNSRVGRRGVTHPLRDEIQT